MLKSLAIHRILRSPSSSRRILLGLLAVACLPQAVLATTYYVDSVAGDDSTTGTTIAAPWRSTARVNQVTFQPGDFILFKRGCTFTGHLHPSGNGSAGNPIVLAAYGEGNRPIFDGEGNSMPAGSSNAYLYMDINVNYGGSAVSFFNQDYWEIRDIAVTNKGPSEGIRRGLFIVNSQNKTYQHWKISGCLFFDINGWNDDLVQQGKSLGGIAFLTNGRTTNNLVIEDNELYGIRGGALWIAVGKGGGLVNKALWGTGLIIRNNVIRDIGTMALLCSRAKNPLIEHNVAYRCHKNSAAGGIWNADTEGAVFQYNEWYDDGKDGQDGTAFDPDVRTSDTTIQYNYVHDAQGLVCFYTDEAVVPDIIRYNVCVNLHTGSSGIVRYRSGHPAHVYNNTFYITSYVPGGGRTAFSQFSGTVSSSHTFQNNLVYLAPTASSFNYGFTSAPASKVSHNCFAGVHPASEPQNDTQFTIRVSDPFLVNPGPSQPGFATCTSYKLRASSPCINAGKVLADNGGVDFFGAPLVDGAPDIGAHEYSPQGYEAWKVAQTWGAIPVSQQEENDNPDGDGNRNGLERFFGTNPAIADPIHYPVSRFDWDATGSLTITLSYPRGIPGASYQLEYSTNLTEWSRDGEFKEEFDPVKGLYFQSHTIPAPIDALRFFRLTMSE